jgi:hypothetical protein
MPIEKVLNWIEGWGKDAGVRWEVGRIAFSVFNVA